MDTFSVDRNEVPSSPPGHQQTWVHSLAKPDEKSEFLAGGLEFQFATNPSGVPHSDEKIEDEVEGCLRNSITTEPELTSEEEVTNRLLALRSGRALDD